MDVGRELARHAEARANWLEVATRRLEALPGVTAVLVYGSIGRGDADEWSDVDLIVALDDGVLARTVDARLGFAQLFGEPLYLLDSTWNAPVDGAQVNALYPVGTVIPIYVDWNLWPSRLVTRVPAEVRVVFEVHPRLPRGGSAADLLAYERRPRRPQHGISPSAIGHAWFGMVPIAAKFVARGSVDRARRLLSGIGAEVPDDASRTELLRLVRERFTTLGVDQEPRVLAAVAGLIDFVTTVVQAEVG